MLKRGSVAIVGAGELVSPEGKFPELSQMGLHAKSAIMAMKEAGLKPSDIDGVACAGQSPTDIAYYLGITPTYVDGTQVGGCSFMLHVRHAVAAIESGLAKTVLVTHGESGRSNIGRAPWGFGNSTLNGQFESWTGPAGPPTMFTVPVLRFLKKYGITEEQLAMVAVVQREYAARNPNAMMKDPITVEDVLNSRMIADPLHLLDCSLVSDGGAAIILTSAERARDRSPAPVYLLGSGEGHSHEHISQARSLTTSAAVESGRRAFAMAGLGPADISVAGIYDCFTPVVLIQLEDLGFCAKGEAGSFVAAGETALGGSLPMNTHGGLLSHCHPGNPGAMFALTEMVRQLRHTAGDRQVREAEVALVHAQGGIMSSHSTLILGREVS